MRVAHILPGEKAMSKKSKFILWLLLSLGTVAASLYWWQGFSDWQNAGLRLAAAGGAWLLLLTLPEPACALSAAAVTCAVLSAPWTA